MKISLSLSLIKLSFSLFFLNLYFLASIGFAIPYCTQITSVFSVSIIALDIVPKKVSVKELISTISPMLVYGFYILTSGYILALTEGYRVNFVYTYFEKILLAGIAVYIIQKDESYEYLLLIGIVIATAVSVYAIANIDSVSTRLRLSDNVSENSTGLLLTYGVLCTFLT